MDSSVQPAQGEEPTTIPDRNPDSADPITGTSQPSLTRSETLGEGEADRLKDLATEVRDQDDLERDVHRQADQLLIKKADEQDQKRLEKTKADRGKLQAKAKDRRDELKKFMPHASRLHKQAEVSELEESIKSLDTDLEQIQERIDLRQKDAANDAEAAQEETGNRRMPGESQREFLIRTGKITPFSKMPGRTLTHSDSSLHGMLLDAEEESVFEEPPAAKTLSHRNLVQPGFRDDEDSDVGFDNAAATDRPSKRRRLEAKQSPAKQRDVSTQEAPSENENDNSEASSEDEEDSSTPGGQEAASERHRCRSKGGFDGS